MRVVPFLEKQIRLGFRPPAVERLLRVMGESLRRIAEQEADWWRTEVIEPALAAGLRGASLAEATSDLASSTEILADARVSLLAMLDAWRAQNWTRNIIVGLESDLVRLGLYQRVDKPPAVCFFDISGYTRLTQERGDQAAAELARDLSRLVQRVSTSRRGKPIKWLGDGVMLYFGEPVKAVEAALEMVDGVARFGLPPAHVGIDAGPVLFQEGDYFGKTVNVASRIADYARPGEVLVSQAVVDASGDSLVFSQIGPVELKGVGSAIVLFSAHPH
jgi:adenylate cyclase